MKAGTKQWRTLYTKRQEKGSRAKGQVKGVLVTGWDFQADVLASSQHWGVIWPRAIAKAWTDPDFKARLINDPKGTFESELSYPINPALDLIIKDSARRANTYNPKKDDPWVGIENSQLTLYLPPAPANQNQYAIAVADYADTGRSYPFTSL